MFGAEGFFVASALELCFAFKVPDFEAGEGGHSCIWEYEIDGNGIDTMAKGRG